MGKVAPGSGSVRVRDEKLVRDGQVV